MIPFILDDAEKHNIQPNDTIVVRGIKDYLVGSAEEIKAELYTAQGKQEITLKTPGLTREERDIILAGCLINYYSAKN